MPVYESIKNADNKIVISPQNAESVVFGRDTSLNCLADLLVGGKKTLAIDGWYGIDNEKIAAALAAKVEEKGKKAVLIPAVSLFCDREAVIAYHQPYVTDDPGFGKVNTAGVIEDIMKADALEAVKAQLAGAEDITIVYGVGASVKAFEEVLDI